MKTILIDTRKKHKIFYDPLRQSILKAMRLFGEPMTAKDVSKNLGVAHSKIHYHMLKLLELEAIKLDHEKVINGIVAKYYVLDFKDVNILADPKEHLTNAALMDETLRIIQNETQENFEQLQVSYEVIKDKLEKGERVFGIHFYNDEIYLSFEERMALQQYIRDYMIKHGQKPQNMKETTKTKVHFQMFDIEIHE